MRAYAVGLSAATASAALALALRWLASVQRRRRRGTLWASPATTCSRRVILALEEAGVRDYGFHPVDLRTQEHKSEAFTAMQPFGKVPVWCEEGGALTLTLFESRAIMRHVASGSPLIPSDRRLAAQMEQWISVEYSYFVAELVPLYRERVLDRLYKGPAHVPDEAFCDARAAALAPTLDVLERHLRQVGGPYLVGDYSLADVTFTPYLEVMGACGLATAVEARPHLSAWASRCLARPAWRYCLSGEVVRRAPG
jgi:glutathione S-transferase